MCTTKEKILLTSLKLFAQDGYEAVSISKISGELGMAKSALYKHYKNKRQWKGAKRQPEQIVRLPLLS